MTGKPKSLLQELKSSHALRQALCIYMVVTVVMFMVILTTAVNHTVTRNNQQWLQEAHASIRQAQALNDTNIRNISNYILQSMETYEVRALLYNADYSTYLSIQSRDVYEQMASISSLIRSIQFINYKTQTVIDHNGRFPFNTYGDQDILVFLENLEPSLHTRIYYHPRTMNTSPSSAFPSGRKVISMVYYLNKAGALVVNLDYDTYQSIMLSSSSESPSAYFLFNDQGRLFCSSDGALFADSLLENNLYQQIIAQEADEGSFLLKDRSGRYTVTFVKNTIFGANYAAITKHAGIYFGGFAFWQLLGLGVIFLSASTIISLFLALLTSNPIRKLHKSVREQLSEEMQPDTSLDEISYLNSVYQSIMAANRTLKEKSRTYQLEREGQMLLNLMNPDAPSLRASAAAVSELETQLSLPYFRVIALMPDRRKIQLEPDAQTIRFRIATAGGEILRNLGTIRTIFPPSFQVLFLLNLPETDVDHEHKILASLLPACREALGGMALYMGVGAKTLSIDEISTSYSGAVEAMQYAYVRQLEGAAFSEELIFPDLNTQSYAFDLDEEIVKAIRHMEKEAAEDAIRRFFERISCFNHNQFLRNTMHLDVVLQRLENNLQIEPPSISSRLDTTTIIHWNAEDACQSFTHRALLDIAQLMDMKKSSSGGNELIEQINQVIDNNIFNPDFSITQLADEFSFSVNYLRSLYKAGAGESLSTRITRKRVEAACDLLDRTDESIESITMKLGFSTRNYFFTFFKKHTGMTPAQYRNR